MRLAIGIAVGRLGFQLIALGLWIAKGTAVDKGYFMAVNSSLLGIPILSEMVEEKTQPNSPPAERR